MDYPWSLCPVDVAHFLVSLGLWRLFRALRNLPGVRPMNVWWWLWDGWEQDSFSALLRTKGMLFFQFVPQLSHL